MRVTLLFNPIAGTGRARGVAEALAATLREAGHEASLRLTEPGMSSDRLASMFDRDDLLVILGGDGAVRLASGPAARTQTPVYVFPLGTENLFAREFGMKRSAEQLLGAIERFEVRHVDAGTVEGQDFMIVTSMGFDASVVRDLAAHREGGIRHLSYVMPALRQLVRWRPPALTLVVDEEAVVEQGRGMVFVANSRQYAVRLDPAWRASMTDGLLDVVFLPCTSRTGMLLWLFSCLLRLHRNDRRLIYRTGKRVQLRAEPKHPYQIDGDAPGEALDVSELSIGVRAGALPVLVP